MKEKAMASSKSWLFLLLLLLLSSFPFLLSVAASSLREHESVGRRVLMSFKETPEGANVTFECSRSGPCVRCLYSEKVDEKYRCSETGYRIPFKCVEVQDGSNGENKQKSQKSRSTFEISDSSANAIKRRNLLDDSSTIDSVSQAYLYSEKVDEKYRCGETGYRIPFKCVEVQDGSNGDHKQKSQKSRSTFESSDSSANAVRRRNLLDDSSTVDGVSQAYIAYRSCIPPVDEERLSVVGFEAIVLFLLIISGSGIYFRRRKTVTMPGVASGRIQTNSRF